MWKAQKSVFAFFVLVSSKVPFSVHSHQHFSCLLYTFLFCFSLGSNIFQSTRFASIVSASSVFVRRTEKGKWRDNNFLRHKCSNFIRINLMPKSNDSLLIHFISMDCVDSVHIEWWAQKILNKYDRPETLILLFCFSVNRKIECRLDAIAAQCRFQDDRYGTLTNEQYRAVNRSLFCCWCSGVEA